MKRILIVFTFLLMLIACHTNKTISEVEKKEEVTKTGPQLLFASYKFMGGELTLTNKIITAGKLKPKLGGAQIPSEGDLIFQQLNAEKEILYEEIIANPKVKIVEYSDEEGVFQKKTINLEDPEFTIRVDLDHETRYLAIKNASDKKSKEQILNLTEID